jgi:hypothetical protein
MFCIWVFEAQIIFVFAIKNVGIYEKNVSSFFFVLPTYFKMKKNFGLKMRKNFYNIFIFFKFLRFQR